MICFRLCCTADNGDIPTKTKLFLNPYLYIDNTDMASLSCESVLRALGKIKPNESNGPDNLLPSLFKIRLFYYVKHSLSKVVLGSTYANSHLFLGEKQRVAYIAVWVCVSAILIV